MDVKNLSPLEAGLQATSSRFRLGAGNTTTPSSPDRRLRLAHYFGQHDVELPCPQLSLRHLAEAEDFRHDIVGDHFLVGLPPRQLAGIGMLVLVDEVEQLIAHHVPLTIAAQGDCATSGALHYEVVLPIMTMESDGNFC